jgi:hypothetical protein
VREGTRRAEESGVPHAGLLVELAEALVAHDEECLAGLRPRLIEALGPDGFLEAATVAATFQRMVRIADGTGIPQDATLMTLAGDVADKLSLHDFPSSRNTPRRSWLQASVGRFLKPLTPRLMAWASARIRRSGEAGTAQSGEPSDPA